MLFKQRQGKRWTLERIQVESITDPIAEREKIILPRSCRGTATLIWAKQTLFAKHLSVPVVSSAQAETVLWSEVNHQIPFPIHEIEWDTVEVKSDGIEREVIVGTVPGDELSDHCVYLERNGFKIDWVAVSPSLAYAAFKQGKETVGGSILVRAGSDGTEWVFCQPSGFYLRTVKIAWDRTMESEGYARRLSLELQRSIAMLQAKDTNYTPAMILLWGGGADIVRIRELLAEAISLPVLIWESKERTWVDQLPEVCKGLWPLVAGALEGSGKERLHFNLFPKELKKADEKRFETRSLLLGGICWIGAGLIFFGWGILMNRSVSEWGNALRSRLKGPLRIESRMDELDRDLGRIQVMSEELKAIEAARYQWIQFLQDLQTRLGLVESVWIDQLRVLNADELEEGERFDSEIAATSNDRYFYLKGSVLDRDHPLERVSQTMRVRVDVLLEALLESSYIETISNQRFDTSERGILHFECVIKLSQVWSL